MKVLVIGGGGREHALAWKLSLSKEVQTVYVAPGNAGTALEHKVCNISLTRISDLITFAKQNAIDFTVVGPEAPLALGIVDEFRKAQLQIWGPTQYCAQLESSKDFAKNFMLKYNIPTAKYVTFNNPQEAKLYLQQQNFPLVIKADGLAAGKGVLIASSLPQALAFIEDVFIKHKFGSAGNKVIIEEYLEGIEASFMVMIDGKNILAMASSQDHKRLLDNDQGPNTGGMGAYSPAPIITPFLHDKIIREIIQPVINGMQEQGHIYTGFLYAGLMIDKAGNPKTLEFNCRLGDPETQPIMLRLNSDLAKLICLGLNQQLNQAVALWDNQFAISVVLASHGYPEMVRKNDKIKGLTSLEGLPNLKVFHAATQLKHNELYTNGGRVLCITAMDINLQLAQAKAYQAINKITFAGMHYRKDIAQQALIK